MRIAMQIVVINTAWFLYLIQNRGSYHIIIH